MDFERMLIFYRTITDCGSLYAMFISNVPKEIMCYIDMFHSKTWANVKQRIQNDMSINNGNICLLICTSAAGMGVNFVGVKHVVHFSPPYNTNDVLQQLGCAGRDGKQAFRIIVYCLRQKRELQTEMLSYIRTQRCYRQELLSNYNNLSIHRTIKGHYCCDVCANNCACTTEECYINKHDPIFKKLQDNDNSGAFRSHYMEYMTCNVDANIEIDVHIALSEIIDNHICTNDVDLYESSDVFNSIISDLSHIFFKTNIEELCIICCSELLHATLNILANYYNDFK